MLTNQCKKSIQKKAYDALHKKSSTGDIAPKPSASALLAYSKDAYFLLNKATPFISKSMTNSVGIGFMIAAGGILILMDDTSRNMIMDQISQVMALFQNENGKTNNGDTNPTVDKINQPQIEPSNAQPYKRPHYYL